MDSYGKHGRCKQCNPSKVGQDLLIYGVSIGSSAVQVRQVKIDSKLLQAVGDSTSIRGVKGGVRGHSVVLRASRPKMFRDTIWLCSLPHM